MIKKLILVLYAAILMIYMTACAAPQPVQEETSEEDVGFVEDMEEEVEEAAEDTAEESVEEATTTEEAPASEEAADTAEETEEAVTE